MASNIRKTFDDVLEENAIKCNLSLQLYKKLLYSKQLTQDEIECIVENYRPFGEYDSDSEEVLPEQLSVPKEESKNHICHVCNKTFRNQFGINLHKRAIHPTKRIFKCDFANCDKIFKSEKRLARHIATHDVTEEH